MIISFVNHKIKLKKEDNLFKTNGKLVEVNNHNINVYISGNSDSHTTLVFMSGMELTSDSRVDGIRGISQVS